VNLFKVTSENKLERVEHRKLPKEDLLEGWLVDNPEFLGLDLLIIGRQVITDFAGRIDILAMDSKGDLTIIELKRDRTPRDIVGQVLDYASWVSGMSTERVHDVAAEYLHRPLKEVFSQKFGMDPPKDLNSTLNMVIVASELDESSRRIVEYLARAHGVSINTRFFNTFDCGGTQFVGADWLMDQEEVEARAERKKRPEWTGFWYVNVDDSEHHRWEDCRKCGFLAAGGGRVYSDALLRLAVGDRVFAYQKKAGYVGFGTVTRTVAPAKDLVVDGKGLCDCASQSALDHDSEDPDIRDYAVGIEWKKTFSISEAKSFPGIFANPNVVCKLGDQRTVEFLRKVFLEGPA